MGQAVDRQNKTFHYENIINFILVLDSYIYFIKISFAVL